VVRTKRLSLSLGTNWKGMTSYFASDEGRDRGKLMLEALLRSVAGAEHENSGSLRGSRGSGKSARNNTLPGSGRSGPSAIMLDDLRVDRWKSKEINGAYTRHLLHLYFIWDPVLHHRLAGKPASTGGQTSLDSQRESPSSAAGSSTSSCCPSLKACSGELRQVSKRPNSGRGG